MRDKIVLGIDPSIAGCGLVVAQIEITTFGKVLDFLYPQTKPLDAKHPETGQHGKVFYGTTEERINHIRRATKRLINKYDPDFAGIEDYAFSKRSTSATLLHELGGVLKGLLFLKGLLVEPPINNKTLKKFATGSGSADKDRMVEAAIGFGFSECPNDDLGDSFHVCRYIAWKQSGAVNL